MLAYHQQRRETKAEDRMTVPGRDGDESKWEDCSVANPGEHHLASLGLSFYLI